jgi:hypothetical protein
MAQRGVSQGQSWITTLLWVCAGYFAVCGASALFWPNSWLYLAGLPVAATNEIVVLFGVVGTYMLALALAATIAACNPQRQLGIIVTLGAANLLDLMVTVRSLALGQLPMLQGLAFCLVALAWVLSLGAALIALDSQAHSTLR